MLFEHFLNILRLFLMSIKVHLMRYFSRELYVYQREGEIQNEKTMQTLYVLADAFQHCQHPKCESEGGEQGQGM